MVCLSLFVSGGILMNLKEMGAKICRFNPYLTPGFKDA